MPSTRASSWSGHDRGRGKGRGRPYDQRRSQPYQNPRAQRMPSVTPSQISSRQVTPAPTAFFVPNHATADNQGDDFLEQVIMAIDLKEKGKVGCAYYIACEERLLCMEEVIGGGPEVVEKLTLDLQPTTVILSPRCDASASNPNDRLRRSISLVDSNDEPRPLPYQVEIRPTPEFSYDGALNKLAGLCSFAEDGATELLIPGEAIMYEEGLQPEELGLTKRRGKTMQISAWLDLDNRMSIGCAGAIVSYLQRRRSTAYLPHDPDDNQAFRVARLEMFTLKGTMLVNTDTLVSLQIIQPESHPNAFNQGPGASGAKESLSIYGLFHHHARTPQGRVLLRQAFLRPSLDVDHITTRQDFISVFVRPENQLVRDKLSKSLGKIKNMRNTITLLHKGIDGGKNTQNAFESGVWETLLAFCLHAIDIAETLGEVLGAERLPLYIRGADVLDRKGLMRIGRVVTATVDTELTTEERRTVVKRGVSQELDNLKDGYDGMEEILSKVARDVQLQIPRELNLIIGIDFFPHMGYHITMPKDSVTKQAIFDGQELGWQLMFTTPTYAYFKDDKMIEMDHELGDIYSAICEMEVEIAYELAQSVLQDEELLVTASDMCGELDCLLAFAHVAHESKLTRPKITEDNTINIKGGRHLLQEMVVPSFVANDTYLVGGTGEGENEGPNMLLLTGPNYSGKSVYQKQVALAVYMAQVGSFVPANSATIGITDKILTRITTRETVSKVQSAFMIDMQQIAIALNSCTRRSLVVIDEFGKGTDTCDGAGLAAGVFHHLLSLGSEAPKTLVATHFHEIFSLGIFADMPNISFAHMEVHVEERDDRSAGEHNSEITYLYNLRPGRSDLSYGTQCAAMNGVPMEIVDRAVELARLASKGEDLVSICSALKKDDMEELRYAEKAARMFLAQDFDRDWTKDGLVSALDVMLEIETGSETSLS